MKKILLSLALACAALAAAAQSITPYGTPTNVAVSASAQSLSVPSVAKGGAGSMELMATCIGTVTCFYRYDGVTATTANAYPLPAGQSQPMKIPANTGNLSVISTGAGSTFYLFAIR